MNYWKPGRCKFKCIRWTYLSKKQRYDFLVALSSTKSAIMKQEVRILITRESLTQRK